MKIEQTETAKKREHDSNEYSLTDRQHVDFINDKNRLAFKHICKSCLNYKWCQKWHGKIICICQSYKER